MSASLFEPAFFGVSLGRRTSLSEIDIVLQICSTLDAADADHDLRLRVTGTRWQRWNGGSAIKAQESGDHG